MLSIFHWILLTGFTVCFIACMYLFLRVMLASKIKQNSRQLGNPFPAIVYSFTGAMSPVKKETAFLHLPTYTAGILFHSGTFVSFLLLGFLFFGVPLRYSTIFSGFLAVTSISGFSILIKRIWLKKMRTLSNPDDYISNILVSLFHALVALTLIRGNLQPCLFIYCTFLLLYIPLGKLRHTVFFFTSRFHLGIFYGWRGVWPAKRRQL